MKALLHLVIGCSFSLLIFPSKVSAQASACPAVDAGLDQTICGGCTNLTASVQGSVATTSYSLTPIAYNPYSYTAGPQVLVNIDDIWTPVITIPFCFEFYGNTYTQCVIGSNGLISFNTALANAYCEWQITAAAPNTSAYDNCIMAPYHDIDPSIGTSSEVHYNTYGVAPCREFVISWYSIPMYSGSCNALLASQQIVLHESTNIIDIYIANKPLCASWNSGAAIEGIINAGATQSMIVPGRNYPTTWTAVNDGQRFMPTGTPNYSVSWTGPSGPLGSTTTINVCPTTTTTYTATVTNNSCAGPIIVSDQVTVTINSTLSATASSTPSSCTANNGTATANPSGGSGSYSYNWAPAGGTSQTATGLSPGNYTVTITDNITGCVATQTVAVANTGGITATASSTDATCTASNGTATANPSGGSGNYSYNWAPAGGTGQTATGLASGSYTVTITDNSNGCTVTQTVNVGVSGGITSTASQTNNSCSNSSDGSATVTPNGGTAPYTYSWTASVSTTNTASGLAPGTYTVTITDVNGCTSTQSFLITSPPALTASATQTNLACYQDNSGAINIAASGGSPGYSYTWSPPVSTSASANSLSAGTYVIVVNDLNGCTTTQSVTLTEPSQLQVSTSSTPVNCATQGTATASPSGGTGPYSYLWAPTGGTGSTETNLAPGTYTVGIADANGCTASQTITVTQVATMQVSASSTDATCFASSNGSGTVTPTGGSAPYTYQWSPSGGTNATATGLAAGTYTVLITDALGCTATQTVIISQPTQITGSSGGTAPTCNGSLNGSAFVTASGGTGSFTYQWSPSGGSSANATGLGAGTYSVVVTDANGCTFTQSVVLTQPPAITAVTSGDQVCPGSPATLAVAVSGGAAPLTYAWSNGPTSASQSLTGNAATAGTYTVVVTDANGCTQIATAALSLLATPAASYTTDATNGVVILTGGTGQICFTDQSTGATSWQWNFNGQGTSAVQSPCFAVNASNAGTFCTELIVQNSAGCYDTTQSCVEVGQFSYSIPNVFTPNADGNNDQWIITNEGMTRLHCTIYDRWGVLIYEWDGTTGNWDGQTTSGKEAVDGVYYFTAQLTDLTGTNYEEHGFFQLIR